MQKISIEHEMHGLKDTKKKERNEYALKNYTIMRNTSSFKI